MAIKMFRMCNQKSWAKERTTWQKTTSAGLPTPAPANEKPAALNRARRVWAALGER